MDPSKKRLTVGAGGIDPRDVRLIEIVFRHSQYNPIEFELQTRLELKTAEVLLINPMTPEGLKALAKLRTSGLNIPVISVVPRGASPGSKYAIALDRLTLQLLPMLNKVVDDHYGHEVAPGVQAKLMDSHASSDFANEHIRKGREERSAAESAETAARFASSADSAARQNSLNTEVSNALGQSVGAATEKAAEKVAESSQAASANIPVELSPSVSAPAEIVPTDIRILVVDDSPTVRGQLCGAASALGLAVDAAASAADGLRLCEEKHFDLALVDVVMPEMDGYKLTKEIRKRFKSTPVIILTSKSSPFDLARGALAGCDTYLVKPVTMQRLKDAMFKSLRKSMAIDDVGAVLQAQLARHEAARLKTAPLAPPVEDALSAASTVSGASNVRVLPRRDTVKLA